MTDPRFPSPKTSCTPMSTTSCRRSGAAMSRPGSRRIPTMPSGCSHGARWRRRCMRVTTPSPTSRCRSGSRSSGWCGSRADGSTARSPRRWSAFIAGGGAGWFAHGAAAAPSVFQNFTRGCAGCAPALCRRGPPSGRGARQRARASAAWLTKRCGWDVRAPELDATGLKLVGGRLLPGPTGRLVPDV